MRNPTPEDLAAAREKAAEEMLAKHEMLHLGTRYDKWGLVSTIAQALASARAAGEAAGIERAAQVADRDAIRAAGLLATAKKRYAKRELLAAVGAQNDPDAECIHLEACENTAKDIAAVIRSLSPQGGPDER